LGFWVYPIYWSSFPYSECHNIYIFYIKYSILYPTRSLNIHWFDPHVSTYVSIFFPYPHVIPIFHWLIWSDPTKHSLLRSLRSGRASRRLCVRHIWKSSLSSCDPAPNFDLFGGGLYMFYLSIILYIYISDHIYIYEKTILYIYIM
jgi:hypothetical protein